MKEKKNALKSAENKGINYMYPAFKELIPAHTDPAWIGIDYVYDVGGSVYDVGGWNKGIRKYAC